MLTVLIVDDHQLARSGLRSLIEPEPDLTVTGEAGDGSTAVELARRLRPDVVLMDLKMPGGDGLTATRIIADDPELVATKVIVLTSYDSDDSVMAALRYGASGYLLKDFEAPALLQSIRTAAAGEALLAPVIARRIAETWTPPARSATPHPGLADLTEREREVLVKVTEGLSNAELAAELHISPATAKTHVSRILAKLDARDRVQLVIIGYRSGLVGSG
ncbi:response regulator transcription factor [Tsukamurella asaccharolytica]|uniref:Response regulator transcription factor n=1 Tax=Tsukamurella asaccharolytica TaxID=2592067 RepID=A0A5C5RD66_9ACTN|nr:response regulator transcription factor [Tsukamurella asaccharolytica]TWS20880.1 response regulator transcription factor [Tsukamurella asaccharolytica]